VEINATVFIQIFNFWVTYFILNKILFRPTVELFDRRKKARAKLHQELKEKELQLKEQTAQKQADLEGFRIFLRDEYKTPQAQVPKMPSEIVYQRDSKQVEDCIKACISLLTEKVPDACGE